ncbi:TlpA family protein disulfide reductase [Pedobacter alluvionis]|nr:TlpA disulfide reductase family protein [Pedobacter alluvionis]
MAFSSKAQSSVDSIPSLMVGDQLPEDFWKTKHQIYNGEDLTNKDLSGYKGKLLILDFWATWCGSCVSSLPKLSKLQQNFTGKMKVILVNCYNTRDNEKKISDFYLKRKDLLLAPQLPTVINDRSLLQMFPHRIIPHYVWIDANGTVAAITNSQYINACQIKQLLSVR